MAHPDSAALIVLAGLLASPSEIGLGRDGLSAPIEIIQEGGEIAGALTMRARALTGASLDAVMLGLDAQLAAFARRGVDEAAVSRVRTAREVELYSLLESVDGRAEFIARYDAVTGRSNFIELMLDRLRAVTAADVMRVFRTYLEGRPRAALSTVPRGQPALALAGSRGPSADPPVSRNHNPPAEPVTIRTTDQFDRSIEPPFGPAPRPVAPAIWTATLPNGFGVSGIESREQPFVHFEFSLDGGRLFDDPARPGIANLFARMLLRGTAQRTPEAFARQLAELGARLEARALDDRIVISGGTPSRSFAATMALIEEVLRTPRWDSVELVRVKAEIIAEIQAATTDPVRVARRILDRAQYGDAHILSRDPLGTREAIGSFGVTELRAFHAANLSPGLTRIRLVGAINRRDALDALRHLGERWPASAVTIPNPALTAATSTPRIYFHAVPGASQAVILVGAPGPRRAATDYFPATVMNFALGGSGFTSRLTREVREARGYTSSIRSRFEDGRFLLETAVRADAVPDALALVRRIITEYSSTFDDADMALTRESLSRRRARAYETAEARLAVLAAIGDRGLPRNYLAGEAAVLTQLTPQEVRALAAHYLSPEAMTFVIVGDPAIRARLSGFQLIDLAPMP